jgi:hypothetical protein
MQDGSPQDGGAVVLDSIRFAEVFKNVDPKRTETFSANFFTGEAMLLDEEDVSISAR